MQTGARFLLPHSPRPSCERTRPLFIPRALGFPGRQVLAGRVRPARGDERPAERRRVCKQPWKSRFPGLGEPLAFPARVLSGQM